MDSMGYGDPGQSDDVDAGRGGGQLKGRQNCGGQKGFTYSMFSI